MGETTKQFRVSEHDLAILEKALPVIHECAALSPLYSRGRRDCLRGGVQAHSVGHPLGLRPIPGSGEARMTNIHLDTIRLNWLEHMARAPEED